MRAEQRERSRAGGPETKAFIKRKAGCLTDGLVSAAVWQTYLFPGKTRPSRLDDVVDELLTSPVDAVRALVGASSRETLRDRLAECQHILEPDQSVLMRAAEWAEREGLPALLPLEAAKLADEVKSLRRTHPDERDGLLLARAVRDLGVAEQLPPEARQALERLLERLEQVGG